MSNETDDRPLANWTIGHILAFLGLAGAGSGAWLVLNERVAKVETAVEASATSDNIYRSEQTRRAERLEDKVDRLLMAQGIKPQ